jgi:hypothetical protein
MSGQSQVSLSFIERTPWARYAFVVLLLVIGAVGISITWEDARAARASTSVLHLRIFLIGVALVWAVGAATLALVPWWGRARTWLIGAHLLIMGLYIGLAIATTNWTGLTIRGWWQFWWAFPLMGGQIQQVLKLLRVPPSPQARSPRLVRPSTNALPETGGLHS